MIYFIQDAATFSIKIGRARDPQARLAELQVGSPSLLTLLFVTPGSREKEAALHARFRRWRRRGEWFRPAPAILRYLIRRAAKATSLPDGVASSDGILSLTRQKIHSHLQVQGESGTAAIAAAIGMNQETARRTLNRMTRDGQAVRVVAGTFRLPPIARTEIA